MISFIKKIYSNLTLKEKYFWWALLSIFIFSVLFSVFNFIQKSTIIVPKAGGVLKIGVLGQPSNINPILAKDNPDRILTTLLFIPLSKLTDKIESIDNNTNIWRIRLKEGIFWSDGKKITSDDIIFTILKIKEAKDNSQLYYFWQNIEAERLSELEVQFKLGENYSFFKEVLDNFYIVPKHIFADLPVLNWSFSEYNLRPVSNGKYVINAINILKNGFISEIVLKVNKYYLAQKPYIPQINIKFYTNIQNLMKAFNTGEIQNFALTDFNNFLNLDLKRPYDIQTFPVLDYYAVFINQSQNLALKDLNVRKAMFISLDRARLVSEVFDNYALSILNPLPWFEENKRDIIFDIETASKILDENGWKLNEFGIREKKIKDTTIFLSFKLFVPNADFLVKTAEILSENWSKIGIKIEIIRVDPDELFQKNIVNRDYELILFGNAVYPEFNLYPFWHSSFIFHPGLNLSLYSNNKVDDLLIDLYKKLNIDKNKIINDILENIYNDHPAIFLYEPKYLLISSKNIYGIKEFLISSEENMFKNIDEWYLNTKRAFKK